MKIFKISYITILIIYTIYILLDTFIITRVYQNNNNIISNTSNISTGNITKNDTYYKDDNIEININTLRYNNTNVYVAKVVINNTNFIKTYLANNSYGKNVTATTSNIASSINAILAINGDYYGAQEKGYVLKNGIVYRSISSSNEDLVIYKDGTWEIINEDNISLEELVNKGAYNILSFGPSLIEDGNISVSKNDEVGKAMASNPRTAIGMLSDGSYVFVVSDGRTKESEGLTLLELATVMKNLGCEIAYNLDGGGSSTMYFNGNIINNPTTNGKSIKERKVSDIVYVGY